MLKKSIPALFFSICILALCTGFPSAAAGGLISAVSITDGSGKPLQGFSYNAAVSTYTLQLPAKQKISFTVMAAADDTVLTADNDTASKKLKFSRYIATDTSIDITATGGGSTQTITLNFVLMAHEEDPPTPVITDTPKPSATDNSDPPATNDPPVDIDGGNDNTGTEDNPFGNNDEGNITQPAESPRDIHILLQIGNPVALINGSEHILDAAPYLLSPGYTYVPLRFIAEGFGAQVFWTAEDRRVDILLDGKMLSLHIGEIIPGTSAAAQIVNRRTFVPVRYVSESLGATVNWQPIGKLVIIEKIAF